MVIREYTNYNEEEILCLYASVGRIAYTDSPKELKQSFASSLLSLATYEKDILFGIIRAVDDGHTIVFVQVFCVSRISTQRYWLATYACNSGRITCGILLVL